MYNMLHLTIILYSAVSIAKLEITIIFHNQNVMLIPVKKAFLLLDRAVFTGI